MKPARTSVMGGARLLADIQQGANNSDNEINGATKSKHPTDAQGDAKRYRPQNIRKSLRRDDEDDEKGGADEKEWEKSWLLAVHLGRLRASHNDYTADAKQGAKKQQAVQKVSHPSAPTFAATRSSSHRAGAPRTISTA